MEGMGQGGAHFTDPADLADVGGWAWGDVADLDMEHPFAQGPSAGNAPEDLGTATGLVHIAAAGAPQSPEVSGSRHWSNLLNWRQNPMPWLLLILLMLLGMASVQAAVRVGR